MRRPVAVLLVAACLASCGGTGSQGLSPQAEQLWIDNESGVIDQLQHDLVLGAIGGVPAARQALEQGLYIPLVAFTDFGGCNAMQRSAGHAPPGFDEVVRAMTIACHRLQRAAVLFTRAASRNDPRTLVAAGDTAVRAAPYLEKARLLLQAATATRRS